MTANRTERARPLRADARRNQAQILAAARDQFVEHGAGAPLEEIARRAGVGIGTLYRRFGDRQELMRAVVLDALAHTRAAAESAAAEEPDAFAALRRYMHDVIDLRVSAVIPVLMDSLDLDEGEMRAARDTGVVERLIDAAHADGALAEEVTFADIGMMLVRLSRRLPGPLDPRLNDQLAHRHLDLLVEGLRHDGARREPATGPRLSRADLRTLGDLEPGTGTGETRGETGPPR